MMQMPKVGIIHEVAEEPNVGRTDVTPGGEGSGSTQAAVNEELNEACGQAPVGPRPSPREWYSDAGARLPAIPGTDKDLPQISSSRTLFGTLKKVFTPQNGGPPPAAPGAISGGQLGSGAVDLAHGLGGHVASVPDGVTPGLGIAGNALGIGTALSRIPEARLQSTRLNQVLNEIPEGKQYNSVRDEANFALSQTDKRREHLGNQVAGNGISLLSNTATIATAGHSAPVTVPLSLAGSVMAGTPKKISDNLQKSFTSIKSGAGKYSALGVDRNVHAINLRNLLGNAPAGENTSQYHAEQVVKALGLDPEDLRSNPNAQKLISDKLSSW